MSVRTKASGLNGWNFPEKGTKIFYLCKCQKDFLPFLSHRGNVMYCNNVNSVMEPLANNMIEANSTYL
jgi:hypothetical protein